jgi:acyl-CoA synthetase (NDP forming)
LTRRGEGGATWLGPDEIRSLLGAYHIKTPCMALATTADGAANAAEELGYPVAVKLVSPTITHKSDVGGVVLDVRDAAEVRWAFEEIARRVTSLGEGAQMSGVMVQSMIRTGMEAVVGMTRDPVFGPLLMFGLGGVHLELLRDVMFRVHPLTDRDASDMVSGIKGAALLRGYRGAAPGDVAALEEMILRVSALAGDCPEIVEMDLNPVSVGEPGGGCVVLDARVAVRRE